MTSPHPQVTNTSGECVICAAGHHATDSAGWCVCCNIKVALVADPMSLTTAAAQGLLAHAEVLHAEHHSGTFVPTLIDCPTHTTEEYLRKAAALQTHGQPTEIGPMPRIVAQRVMMRLDLDQGTFGIRLQHAARDAVAAVEREAAKEGALLRQPIMISVIAEAVVVEKTPS